MSRRTCPSKRRPGKLALRLLNKIFHLNHGRGPGYGANIRLKSFIDDRDLWSMVRGELRPPTYRTIKMWLSQLEHAGLVWKIREGNTYWRGETAAAWKHIRKDQLNWFMRKNRGEHPATILGDKYCMYRAELIGHETFTTVKTEEVIPIEEQRSFADYPDTAAGEQNEPAGERDAGEQNTVSGEHSGPYCRSVPWLFPRRSPESSPRCSPGQYVPVPSTKDNVPYAPEFEIPEGVDAIWLAALKEIAESVDDITYGKLAAFRPEQFFNTLYFFGDDFQATYIRQNHRAKVQAALRSVGYYGDFQFCCRDFRQILQTSVQQKEAEKEKRLAS